MKAFFSKHYTKIIIALIVLFCFNNIKSCSKNRTINKQKNEIELLRDSISNINAINKDEQKNLHDSIKLLHRDLIYVNKLLDQSRFESNKNRETINNLAKKNITVTNKIEK